MVIGGLLYQWIEGYLLGCGGDGDLGVRVHLFLVPSRFCFFCLARCSFRLFPNFR